MPRIDVTELDKEIRQGKLRPVYVVVGEEPYLAQAALASIREAAGSGGAEVHTFAAQEARPDEVIGLLRNLSLLGSRPMVVIRDGEALTKERKASMAEALADYIASPIDSSVLVITAEKMDGRSRLMQLAAKSGAVVECRRLYDDRLPSWIGMQVKRRERQISIEAAKFLAEMVGNDLGQISGAIDRVILYIGSRRAIELGDVEEAVAETHQRDVFDLTDAVGRRQLARALSFLHNLIQNGQPPTLILHMLARHFRMLAKAREISGRTSDRAEMARYIGVNPYYLQGYVDQAKNFSRSELRAAFAILHRCDRGIKSSRLQKERVIERAVVALTEKKGAAR
ncbi:MAG: DNA polymerase III subunit delta [Proteobacteria bacterium]|nr:DNA polymerase III subunit delta [Pseudomonadota bacterium]